MTALVKLLVFIHEEWIPLLNCDLSDPSSFLVGNVRDISAHVAMTPTLSANQLTSIVVNAVTGFKAGSCVS